MARVEAPNDAFTGVSAGVTFKAGKAETDDPAALAYFRGAGYRVDGETYAEPAIGVMPEPADPRYVEHPRAAETRDAAVDPRPGDHHAPVNAGKPGPDGDPHGPNVASIQVP